MYEHELGGVDHVLRRERFREGSAGED
jgi:hypothetical protein